MKKILDENYACVWTDEVTSNVFVTLNNISSNEQLIQLEKSQRELTRLLRKKWRQKINAIVQINSCDIVNYQFLVVYLEEIIPAQFQSGVKYIAFIKPTDRVLLELVGKERTFDTLEDVFEYVQYADAIQLFRDKSFIKKIRMMLPTRLMGLLN